MKKMIQLIQAKQSPLPVEGEYDQITFRFMSKYDAAQLPYALRRHFNGEFLKIFPTYGADGGVSYLIGTGEKVDFLRSVQLGAKCARLAGELYGADNERNDEEIEEVDDVEEQICIRLDAESLYTVCAEECLDGFVRGLWLGDYKLPQFRAANDRKCRNDRVRFVLNAGCLSRAQRDRMERRIERQTHVAKALYFARDMTNMPSNLLTPAIFSDKIANLFADTPVEVEVVDYEGIRRLGMGGLLAVGESSGHLPRFVILRYRNASAPVLGLVGKGVMVDTGGYCIKPGASMPGMRGDMAGAAAVAATVYALAMNREPVNVTALLPLCENRISRESFLPGDVLKMYSGDMVEVLNTDAEGRLILADAVSYAVKEEKVDAVIDIATLTGAVVSMFGFTVGGVMTDSEQLADILDRVDDRTEERHGRIPYYEEHEEMIKSDCADVKNLGPGHCGTITAGLFIRHFAEGKPWMHFDIAGTAWVEPPIWEHQSKGATGAGVITLYEMAKEWVNDVQPQL